MLSVDDNMPIGKDEKKPAGKSGQRKKKKADARKQKAAQQPAAQQDDLHEVPETIDTPSAAIQEVSASSAESAPETPEVTAESAASMANLPPNTFADSPPAEAEPVSAPTASLEEPPVSQTIADSATLAPEPVEACASTEDSAAKIPAVAEAAVPAPQADPVSFQTLASAYDNFARHSLDQTRSFFEKLSGVRSIDKAFELQTEFARQAYDNLIAESHKIRELHRELASERLKRWEGFVGMCKPR